MPGCSLPTPGHSGQPPPGPPCPGPWHHHCHAGKKGHERRGNLMGRQAKASIHTISLNRSISNLLLKQKGNEFSPQTPSLSRAVHSREFRQHLTPRPATLIPSFSSKQRRPEQGIFLPAPTATSSLPSPGNRKQGEPARAMLPSPQTGAAGNTQPLNTTDLLLANNGIERPWSQVALCLSHKKMAFVPKAVCCLGSYTARGHGGFIPVMEGPASAPLPQPTAFLTLYTSACTEVSGFVPLAVKGKTSASMGKKVPPDHSLQVRSCGVF